MADLDGHDAFVALSHLLDRIDAGARWQARSPAIERLRRALVDPGQAASGLDLAVLLRQAMTHEHGPPGRDGLSCGSACRTQALMGSPAGTGSAFAPQPPSRRD